MPSRDCAPPIVPGDETGKDIVATWLLSSSLVALIRLASRMPEILAHVSAWRAAVGPFVVALLGILAAWRLFRRGDGVRLASIVLALPSTSRRLRCWAFCWRATG